MSDGIQIGSILGASVTVNKEGATRALTLLPKLLRGLGKQELLFTLGVSQMVSVRRTFREQGSPAGSWVPLAPGTIARNPKKYGAGHKLLIDSGRLLNSITFATDENSVTLGTNVKYAAVQNYGSRDRTGGPAGPQAKLADRAAQVPGHYRTIKLAPRYELRTVEGKDGKSYRVPHPVTKQKTITHGKDGKLRSVTRNIEGPQNQRRVKVRAHGRHQNIPARPFMVFRPEDVPRMLKIAEQWVSRQRSSAGLAGGA